MNIKQKREYAEAVNERFINARNHGHSGNNWWYPVENTIAYNVKVYSGPSLRAIKEKMTERQKDYFSDESLYESMMYKQSDQATMAAEDIENNFKGVKSTGYAGRSGGWLEVEFINDIGGYLHDEDIKSAYIAAKELEDNEVRVSEFIKKSHKWYIGYIESEEYINDFIESLMTDEDIADIYRGKIKTLADKLK